MKLVTYKTNGLAQTGILVNQQIYPLNAINQNIANNMRDMLNDWDNQCEMARAVEAEILDGKHTHLATPCTDDILEAPVPQPTSC
jgi:hypothetical protein